MDEVRRTLDEGARVDAERRRALATPEETRAHAERLKNYERALEEGVEILERVRKTARERDTETSSLRAALVAARTHARALERELDIATLNARRREQRIDRRERHERAFSRRFRDAFETLSTTRSRHTGTRCNPPITTHHRVPLHIHTRIRRSHRQSTFTPRRRRDDAALDGLVDVDERNDVRLRPERVHLRRRLRDDRERDGNDVIRLGG